MRLAYALLLNLLLTSLWVALSPQRAGYDFVLGFAISFLLIALLYREYGRRMWWAMGFAVFVIWSIVKSSLQVAGYCLQSRPRLDQGIVAVPLRAQTNLEIAALATSITLAPGVISVDVDRLDEGVRILYVHSLVTGDADRLRREIQKDFEQRILRITRGAAAAGDEC